jgi:hypothetical protein
VIVGKAHKTVFILENFAVRIFGSFNCHSAFFVGIHTIAFVALQAEIGG